MQQQRASPHTIASYRDTFRLLLKYMHKHFGTSPSKLAFEQLDAVVITDFLGDLECKRGVSTRSRNLRLSAIRSFFHYAAFEAPAHSAQIQRVLAIPSKRGPRNQVSHLTRQEVEALLAAPDLCMGRSARSRAPAAGGTDGVAALRTDRPVPRGCQIRHRRSRSCRRKGAQGAVHAVGEADPPRPADMDANRLASRV
jgi:hypothetical protein